MTGLSMADPRRTAQQSRLHAVLPLLPVMVSTFFVAALIWYRVQVLPSVAESGEWTGNWLAQSVAWMHARIGFLPAFLMAVLGLAWSSLWFFTGPLERPRARLGYLVVFGLCLSIAEGMVSEQAGSIGAFVAVRLESVFGALLASILAFSASLFAFLLASDFCFFRYFESFGLERMPRSAGAGTVVDGGARAEKVTGEKITDEEVESEAIAELMARPAAVDGATPLGPMADPSSRGGADSADVGEAAALARRYLEDAEVVDPLQVEPQTGEARPSSEEAFGSEPGSVQIEPIDQEQGVHEEVEAVEEVDAEVDRERDGPEHLDPEIRPLFDSIDDLHSGDSGSESRAEGYDEGSPTIIDVGLSSVEIPIPGTPLETDAADGSREADSAEGVPLDGSDRPDEPSPEDSFADSQDDLSAWVALREAGFLGGDSDESERELGEPVEADELQALLGAVDSLDLDDGSDSKGPQDLQESHGLAPEESEEPDLEDATSRPDGWLFPSMANEAEVLDDELDDLVSEAESLAKEAEDLTSGGGGSGRESSSSRFDPDRVGPGRSEEVVAESPTPAQGGLFAPVTDDELLAEAEELVRSTGRASVGLLSRRLRIDFDHADNVLAQLETRGVVAIDDESGHVRVLGE